MLSTSHWLMFQWNEKFQYFAHRVTVYKITIVSVLPASWDCSQKQRFKSVNLWDAGRAALTCLFLFGVNCTCKIIKITGLQQNQAKLYEQLNSKSSGQTNNNMTCCVATGANSQLAAVTVSFVKCAIAKAKKQTARAPIRYTNILSRRKKSPFCYFTKFVILAYQATRVSVVSMLAVHNANCS